MSNSTPGPFVQPVGDTPQVELDASALDRLKFWIDGALFGALSTLRHDLNHVETLLASKASQVAIPERKREATAIGITDLSKRIDALIQMHNPRSR